MDKVKIFIIMVLLWMIRDGCSENFHYNGVEAGEA